MWLLTIRSASASELARSARAGSWHELAANLQRLVGLAFAPLPGGDPAPVGNRTIWPTQPNRPSPIAKRLNVRARTRLDIELNSAPVTGDPLLLDRLVLNLVENAFRYNVGRRLRARVVTKRRRASSSIVEIENSGPVRSTSDQVRFGSSNAFVEGRATRIAGREAREVG